MSTDKYEAVAREFCPIFAQKVDKDWPAADQIAPIDFAVPGDIHASVKENPFELVRRSRSECKDFIVEHPKVYYSVCETHTHYFLIYAVYHPLDWWKYIDDDLLENPIRWIRAQFDEHVHDMEGALLVVTKDVEPSRAGHGIVDAVVTVSHRDLLLYANPVRRDSTTGRLKPYSEANRKIVAFQGSRGLAGNVLMDDELDRVKLYMEARGHGIRGDFGSWRTGDEEWWYNVSDFKEDFKGRASQKNKRYAFFDLEDIFKPHTGLWAYRLEEEVFIQSQRGRWTFASFGWVDKQTRRLQAGKANPPWSWNDEKDTAPMGELATDPARFILRCTQGLGPVSPEYIYNPYLKIGVAE